MKKIYLILVTCAVTTIGLGQNQPTNYHFRLSASIGNGNYHTDFYFNNNSTSGMDRGYDAAVFNSTAPSKAIYSKIVDGSYANTDFAIQSLATEFLQSDTNISIGINVPQGQQVVVSMQDSNLLEEITVFLEDSLTGVTTILNDGTYTFTPSTTLNSAGRFYIHFGTQNQVLSTPETAFDTLQIYANKHLKTLIINGQLTEATDLIVYDIQGRQITSLNLEQTITKNVMDVSTLNSGVYIIKIISATQQKTKKVIL